MALLIIVKQVTHMRSDLEMSAPSHAAPRHALVMSREVVVGRRDDAWPAGTNGSWRLRMALTYFYPQKLYKSRLMSKLCYMGCRMAIWDDDSTAWAAGGCWGLPWEVVGPLLLPRPGRCTNLG